MTTLGAYRREAVDENDPRIAKNSLRRLLMTPYPYDFGDNGDRVYTLQEVYFRLYDNWVNEKKEWAKVQKAAKDKYGDGTDAYYTWYETVADSYITAIDEKMSKVISVFTPNDMRILEGVLDSGSGAELQEARQMLNDTRKRAPDGGYVYPVNFYPANWFELLNTSFSPTDLLKDPETLAEKLCVLSARRISINAQIEDLAKLIPSDKAVEDAKNKAAAASTALKNAQNDLIKEYASGAVTVINALLDMAPVFSGGKVPGSIVSKLADGRMDRASLEELEKKLVNGLTTAAKAQSDYVAAAGELAAASETVIKNKALSELASLISPLRTELKRLDAEIEDIKLKIQISSAHSFDGGSGEKNKDTMCGESAVASGAVPDGYTRVYIHESASSLNQGSSSSSASSVQSCGVSFFFGGYSSHSESQSSAFGKFSDSSNSEIDIGMNVAKVGIERPWFNPGVFALTKDMFKLTNANVAPSKHYSKIDDDRLSEMAKESNVFPCYPVAMLIARDISIRFKFESETNSEFSKAVEQHAQSGGGFLCFSGSSSSSSSSSESGVSMRSTGNSITLRFTTPQILGYYLECTHADDSAYIGDNENDTSAFTTISEFVDSYKKILESMQERERGKDND